jgi:hypothetical protein
MRPSWVSVQNNRVVTEADLLWRCRARVGVHAQHGPNRKEESS